MIQETYFQYSRTVTFADSLKLKYKNEIRVIDKLYIIKCNDTLSILYTASYTVQRLTINLYHAPYGNYLH